MKIAWDNKADGAALTVSSEVATLPGANVQQAHVAQKWHTAAGVRDAYIVFDLGAALSCSLLAVLGTNLTSAATVRLRGSDADPAAIASLLTDTGVIAAGVKAGYGAIYKSFAAQAARYWRLDLTDASLPDNIQAGRVFLGPAWTPSVNQLYDWGVTADDKSEVEESYGRQDYADARPQKRVLEFALDYMGEAEMYGNAFALARAKGITGNVLVIPDITSAYVSEQAVWGRVTASQPIRNRITRVFTQQFTMQERL